MSGHQGKNEPRNWDNYLFRLQRTEVMLHR
jgi:hypothetical protein